MALEDYHIHLYRFSKKDKRINKKGARHMRLYRLKVCKRMQLVCVVECPNYNC